jgi:hypothetical protein
MGIKTGGQGFINSSDALARLSLLDADLIEGSQGHGACRDKSVAVIFSMWYGGTYLNIIVIKGEI